MQVKRFLLFPLFIFIVFSTKAQNYLWAEGAGGLKDDDANGVATDVNGNVYVSGAFFSPSITFGPITLTNKDKTGASSDVYLVKYDSHGNVLWAISEGDSGNETVQGVVTDPGGNVYVTGTYESNGIAFGATLLSNKGGADIFLVKYDALGAVLWANSASGQSIEISKSVAIDVSGNVFITGGFYSTVLYIGNNSVLMGSNTNPPPLNTMFVAKFDPSSGKLIWAKGAYGDGHAYGACVTADVKGNIFVTGTTSGGSTLNFGNNVKLTSIDRDMFLVKYDASGNALWAKNSDDGIEILGQSVSTDAIGNSYVLGTFAYNTITFGTTILSSLGRTDIFIVKYDPSGNFLWARSGGGTGDDIGYELKIDGDGNLYFTGIFSFSFTWDTLSLHPNRIYVAFIVKCDASGNSIWLTGAGAFSMKEPGIAIDNSGSAFVAGSFTSPDLMFGATTLINADTTRSTCDMYVVKLDVVTGISEYLPSKAICIYPNPTTNVATILNGEELSGTVYKIYNYLGQELLTGKLDFEETKLNCARLTPGIYMISIGENKRQTIKLIKE